MIVESHEPEQNISWVAASTETTAVTTAPQTTSSTPSAGIAGESQICELWKTSKTQSQKDHEATLILLDLRKQFDKDFLDKKSAKNIIWKKIADHMNNMGFYVGQGTDGREKVRQKFANLQTSYMKFIQKRKLTGEGAIDTPPYYNEINEILGDKHKVCPPIIIDSEIDNETKGDTKENERMPCSTNKNKVKMPQPYTVDSNSCGSSSSTPVTSKNRFMEIKKSCRPQKERVVDVMKDIHKENIERRKEEFTTLVELLREESKQRHIEVMALINSVKKKHSGEKRKRVDTESESD